MRINSIVKYVSHVLLRPDWTRFYRLHRLLLKAREPHITKPMYERLDRTVTVGGYSVPVRVYPWSGSDAVVVYLHGGGWATENVNTYYRVCKNLSERCRCTVVAVDYSLSPESKFPRATHECYLVTQCVLRKAHSLGKRVVLVGDSAGGNLCAVVSLMCRDRGARTPDAQVLLYPVTYYDYTESSPFRSVHENGTDYILTAKRMEEYVALYARSKEDCTHPYFSPLCAEDFSNQPDTLIVTAQYDPLRDEGEYYGKVLSKAGNSVRVVRMRNAMHGFFVHDRGAALKTYPLIDSSLHTH